MNNLIIIKIIRIYYNLYLKKRITIGLFVGMWCCLFKRADPAFCLSSLNLLRSARISSLQSKEPNPRPWALTRVRSSTANPFSSDLWSFRWIWPWMQACLWWRRCLWLLFFEIQILKPVRSRVSEEIIFFEKNIYNDARGFMLGYLNTRMIVKLSVSEALIKVKAWK